HQPIKCAVNPRAGYESEERPAPVPQARHVVVVGAGPAGLETACVAAGRGHRVTLIERADVLGGQLRYSSLMLPEYGKLISYYESRLQALDVSVRLGTEATVPMLVALGPDVIVLATGAESAPLDLPTDGSVKVLQFEDALNERVDAPRAAVVFGGSGVGCLTAAYLATRGSRVTLVEPGPDIA